jgi:hypothetical protein
VPAGTDRVLGEGAGADSAGQATSSEEELVIAAGDAAPLVVPGRPLPRPGDPGTAETAAEQGADADEGVEAEGSDVPPQVDTPSDSRLAAVLAPPPPPRPAAAARTEAAPPRVGSAATQGSLALDATSLIGVIDAASGREALLRTASGEYLKVARGDNVAGWRVSAIGRDAMRLTRGGESRTLLLVTR